MSFMQRRSGRREGNVAGSRTRKLCLLGSLVSLAGMGTARAAVINAPMDAIGGVSFDPLVIPTVSDITVSASPLIGRLLVMPNR